MTTCQPSLAMRPAISISSSLGVKSTSRLTKLKRTPRTPAACRSCSSSSLMLRFTVATPLALPLEDFSASTSARLSAPWQVACTITFLLKPRWSRSANSCSLLASHGVYLRSGAYGNCAPGPKTWQCASTALGGSWNCGLLGPVYQSSQPGGFSKPPLVGLLMAWSIGSDVRIAHEVGITHALVVQQRGQLLARAGKHLAADRRHALAHFRRGQRLLHFPVQLVDDGERRLRGRHQRVPDGRFEALEAGL